MGSTAKDFVMWALLGGLAVLAITQYNGFSTAIKAITTPVEYESALFATGGKPAGQAPAQPG